DNTFRALAGWYERAVGWCLDHRAVIIAVATAIFISSLMLIPLVGFEFFPSMDRGETTLVVETPIGSSVEYTDSVATKIESYILDIPELESLEVYLGEAEGGTSSLRGGAGGARTANFTIKLVDQNERERTTSDIEQELRKYLQRFAGVTSRFAQQMGPGGGDFEVMITGDDLDVLSDLGQEARERLQEIPGLYDVRLDWEPGSPEYRVTVNRAKAGELGLTASAIGSTLQTLVRGTEELTKYREHGKEYDITVRAPEVQRDWIDIVRQTNVVSPAGKLVPLEEIATIQTVLGPTQISRNDRRRSITVQGTKGPDAALSEIVEASREELDRMNFQSGYSYEFAGSEEDRREAFGGMIVALIMGVLLIYMILASLFESLVHPFTIMLAIPLEVIGVFVALLITGLDISIMVMLGILMLTGVVVSNSILLVQMINLLRERGEPLREAIIGGGSIRLRPILMTALATLFAMIPLALAMRAGSEMWQPLGVTVIGGLTTSTFLTLFVIPVAYSAIEEFGTRVTGLFRRDADA
ncbi:MAG: efflux RND transporter permease subunit, partial [Armatimonadota bacterium]